jgi:hypothetical protein
MINLWLFLCVDRLIEIDLLKDKTKSWTSSFVFVGATRILRGFVARTIPLYAYYTKKKRKSMTVK